MTMGGNFGAGLSKAADKLGGKKSGSGSGKPGEDNIAKAQANPQQLTAAQASMMDTFAEASRQRALQAPYVAGAETILGLMPAPGLGAALKVGNAMGAASEDALKGQYTKDPSSVHAIPGQPGGMYGRINGMMYSNRADVPGYNDNLGKDTGTGDQNLTEEELLRRKKAAQGNITPVASSPTTLLGSPIDQLGAVNAIS